MRAFRDFPRLSLVLISVFLAIILFEEGAFVWIESHVSRGGHVFLFCLAGFLSSISITAPFGIALIIASAQSMHPVPAAILTGTGAVLADLALFELVRFSLHEELTRLFRAQIFMKIHDLFHHPSFEEKVREYLVWSFAGLLIASPFPDEFGIFLLGSASRMKTKTFAALCFVLNTIGYFIILSAARAIA